MTDTIPKSEVARVLAIVNSSARERRSGEWVEGWKDATVVAAQILHVYPEFESALKALEKEQGRG